MDSGSKPIAKDTAAARAAIEGLSKSHWNALTGAAAALCLCDVIEPGELLAATIAAYLAGERTWNHNVGTLQQIRSSMRSILCSWRKSRKLRSEVSFEDSLVAGELDDNPSWESSIMEPEREAMFGEKVEIITNHLEDDLIARDVLSALWEGMTAVEIQECLGLDPLTYASTRTRIRRKLAQLRDSGALS